MLSKSDTGRNSDEKGRMQESKRGIFEPDVASLSNFNKALTSAKKELFSSSNPDAPKLVNWIDSILSGQPLSGGYLPAFGEFSQNGGSLPIETSEPELASILSKNLCTAGVSGAGVVCTRTAFDPLPHYSLSFNFTPGGFSKLEEISKSGVDPFSHNALLQMNRQGPDFSQTSKQMISHMIENPVQKNEKAPPAYPSTPASSTKVAQNMQGGANFTEWQQNQIASLRAQQGYKLSHPPEQSSTPAVSTQTSKSPPDFAQNSSDIFGEAHGDSYRQAYLSPQDMGKNTYTISFESGKYGNTISTKDVWRGRQFTVLTHPELITPNPDIPYQYIDAKSGRLLSYNP
ncbi:MAG: hypothetical protein V1822_03895, partial [Candidatus Micrarchaeota archaeon]